MDAAHAASTSTEPTRRQPSRCWTMLPVLGKNMSGVVVPTTMKSMSSGTRLARSSAWWAARTARSDVASLSSTIRRSRMPLR